jgi:broad specificity phosphatase PhoE|uniref:Uncharacterized protein n=1 Tax=Siphoviridae sp. ctLAw30 TaxID=2826249 RepID=A0A8S5M1I6_9CAUD|nr:MAG TPA: hypothetical protein [Siphoviridae sp. ctLAw30]
MNKGKIILTFYFKNGCVIKKNMNLSEISEKKAVELADSLLKLQNDLKTFFSSTTEDFQVTAEGLTVKGSELIAFDMEMKEEVAE